ncbi:Ig-like domain-containing protein [Chelatococcus sp. YT9]|uniref:Ig-like domain-containing protein n=1 Tax=Chelatococcus sp. YT9 TaxID=2835635 RepID=UPI001BCB4F98|nr:Ig-like domain-containing protein [Chelatococcus sp. YT9]MBS7701470.1 cadherin-like domain-containing protein [Chelatococcus sp. YT9]
MTAQPGYRIKLDVMSGCRLETSVYSRATGSALGRDYEIASDGVDTPRGFGGALHFLDISAVGGAAYLGPLSTSAATKLSPIFDFLGGLFGVQVPALLTGGLGVRGDDGSAASVEGGEQLTFRLGSELYGLGASIRTQAIDSAKFDLINVKGSGLVKAELFHAGSKVGEQLVPVSGNGIAISSPNHESFDEIRLSAQGSLAFSIAGAEFLTQDANSAPIAQTLTIHTPEDVAIDLGFLAIDPDGDVITFSTAPTSPHGIFSQASDGQWTFTPDADFSGIVDAGYVVTDGIHSSHGAIQITVDPVNDIPVANADDYAVQGGQPLVISVDNGVLRNDSDSDGPSALQAVLVEGPSRGTIELAADGSFVYTPEDYRKNWYDDENYSYHSRPVMFTYQATDGNAASTATTITINLQLGPGKLIYGNGSDPSPVSGHFYSTNVYYYNSTENARDIAGFHDAINAIRVAEGMSIELSNYRSYSKGDPTLRDTVFRITDGTGEAFITIIDTTLSQNGINFVLDQTRWDFPWSEPLP